MANDFWFYDLMCQLNRSWMAFVHPSPEIRDRGCRCCFRPSPVTIDPLRGTWLSSAPERSQWLEASNEPVLHELFQHMPVTQMQNWLENSTLQVFTRNQWDHLLTGYFRWSLLSSPKAHPCPTVWICLVYQSRMATSGSKQQSAKPGASIFSKGTPLGTLKSYGLQDHVGHSTIKWDWNLHGETVTNSLRVIHVKSHCWWLQPPFASCNPHSSPDHQFPILIPGSHWQLGYSPTDQPLNRIQ